MGVTFNIPTHEPNRRGALLLCLLMSAVECLLEETPITAEKAPKHDNVDLPGLECWGLTHFLIPW